MIHGKTTAQIIVLTCGIFVLSGCSFQPSNYTTEKATTTPTINTITEATTTTDSVYDEKNEIEKIVYINTQYGFEIQLPKGWEQYITTTNDRTENSLALAYVYMHLPTNQKDWPSDEDPKTGKKLQGYASVFAITVWKKEIFNELMEICKSQEVSLYCPSTTIIIPTTSTRYAYTINQPHSIPSDVQEKMPPYYIELIKQSFSITE